MESEQIPSLLKDVSVLKASAGFDSSSSPIPSPLPRSRLGKANTVSTDTDETRVTMPLPNLPNHHRNISISLPNSPSNLNIEKDKNVRFAVTDQTGPQPSKSIFLSQPLQKKLSQASIASEGQVASMTRYNKFKDKRFDSFKTWSGKLERQISNLRGRAQETTNEGEEIEAIENQAIPAIDRYYESLEGPELETLKLSEELILPEDKKWPFLLRFPISSFGMCLGVSSQAILWKTLAQAKSMEFLHVSITVNLVLWCISLVLLAAVALGYILKIVFYFEAVKREYYHPVRVNFFFAPWIACLFMFIGIPPIVAVHLHDSLWYVLMTPILCLELKIYGQWMSGGQRRLSKVANPSNHLSVVGNFVGALLGASMGLKEGPIFFYAVGLAHYSVLFVTLYQRLPTNETLPKELHPVFFLFVAAPSVACVAWANISGDFGYPSRIAYFIALFLYVSLAVRINFFRGFKFSLSWWAYTFPMTGAAIATIRYSGEVNNWLTESMSVAFSVISTVTVSALLVSTVLHAFLYDDLFPNDITIAIKEKKCKSMKTHSQDVKEDLSPV